MSAKKGAEADLKKDITILKELGNVLTRQNDFLVEAALRPRVYGESFSRSFTIKTPLDAASVVTVKEGQDDSNRRLQKMETRDILTTVILRQMGMVSARACLSLRVGCVFEPATISPSVLLTNVLKH